MEGELVSNDLGYLAEEISKQSVEDAAWFLLVAYSKTQEERNKLKKEPLGKKKPALNDLENSQSIQMACSGNRAKGVSGQPFSKEIWSVTHGSNQPSPQKPGIERKLSRKGLWTILLSDILDPHELHERPTCFLGILYEQKHCQLGLKATEMR